MNSAVQFRKLEDIQRDPNNARVHSPEQVEQIANSIRRFGFTLPALVDEVVRAGNGRHAACELIYAAGETIHLAPGKDRGGEAIPPGTMPVLDCSGWSEDERRAYALADNQLAINAEWDEDRLRAEIEALTVLGFDIPLIGFDTAELDRLFNPPQSGRTNPDALPEEPAVAVTVAGDVWIMGNHRIKAGSSTSAADVESVLDGSRPHLMVTDPPYGVNYDPSWRERELDTWKKPRNTGKVQNDDRADWTEAWELFAGDVAYVWHGGLHSSEVENSLRSVGLEPRSQIIWVKQHFVIGRGDYHWQHEPCWYAVRKGKKGRWAGDRKQASVWDIANASAMGGDTTEGSTGHGTQKPVECMRRPIVNNSQPGDLIYEPFSGSFTTGIACEMEGRHCRAIEINPKYVDLGVIRWQDFTGQEARLEATGQTFAEVKAEREAAHEPDAETAVA